MGAQAVCADSASRLCAGQVGKLDLHLDKQSGVFVGGLTAWAVTGDRLYIGLSLMRLCIGLALVIGLALGWY